MHRRRYYGDNSSLLYRFDANSDKADVDEN